MKRVHIVGIGGSGMSAIARVLHEQGWVVSGSDQQASRFTEALAALGVGISIGHRAENVGEAEVVVMSSAIAPDNVEVQAARGRGLPVFKRADFLGELMLGRAGVAIAGTHGKTTTTGLIAHVLQQAGLDPTYIVGGTLLDYDTNARAGAGPFVIEADEYDHMFLGLNPTIAVVTNVEHDHPDIYPTLADTQAAFRAFVGRLPADGLLIACAQDRFARELARERLIGGGRAALYGLHRDDTYRADSITPNNAGGSDFLACRNGETMGLVRIRLPGEHNVLNTLAALAIALELGVDFNVFRNAVAEFQGAGRRFEVRGEVRGVTVVDDYAHHPTEIKATLAAARRRFGGRPVWAMFQPHTYSRTRTLMAEFADSFAEADHVIVTEIFASREARDGSLSGADLARRMQHPDVRFIADLDEVIAVLVAALEPGDVLITLGAGDGNRVGDEVLRRLGLEGR
ncbi:MAG TPA: UDP-N-acetylmuramate--L-alanine ligase [Anaerolineales bacterium]|nr:UDP-N-acetylmuramate--L-alanine ligase [Anaerolineales bacterium]